VVDDNEDSRTLLSMLLESAGARVQTAGSADEALACIARAPPHVLVSDVGMPGKDGYALVRALRAQTRHATLPAVALTGLDRPQDRIDLLRAGFQAHLVKPAQPEELIALIRALAPPSAP
jgi:CheY-like chemotaxis protein